MLSIAHFFSPLTGHSILYSILKVGRISWYKYSFGLPELFSAYFVKVKKNVVTKFTGCLAGMSSIKKKGGLTFHSSQVVHRKCSFQTDGSGCKQAGRYKLSIHS